ncbi:hypothetical protein [Kitasatospora indigofera]|uniref:hypothetical protein n=1 Tax=Kitasatospora indigofera TaxID=67307 RepID=UPI0036907309
MAMMLGIGLTAVGQAIDLNPVLTFIVAAVGFLGVAGFTAWQYWRGDHPLD